MIIFLSVLFTFIFCIIAYNLCDFFHDNNVKIPLFTWYNKNTFSGIAWICIILFVVMGIIKFTSYYNYLDDRSFFDSARYQYKQQIDIYQQKAKVDVTDSKSMTDLKYNMYQNQLGAMIQLYTEKISKYNQNIIEKKKMREDPLWSWLIVGPDPDMVPINF